MLHRRVRSSGPLRVMFVVPGLGVGGAERHVATLLPAMDPARIAPSVVCIGPAGELLADVVAAGLPAVALERRDRPLAALAGLVALMRKERPDVVVVRGYNAEVLGRLAATLTGVPRTVVWVHNCGDLAPRGRLRVAVDRVLDRATSAYYGVAHGQRTYLTEDLGYPGAKVRIVRNGTDPGERPAQRTGTRDAAAATAVGPDSGIDAQNPVVGIVAVLRPEKDHATFLRAARIVADAAPDVRFLIVGDGPLRTDLERLARTLGVAERVVFTGSRSDVPDLLRAMDVFVLSSFTIECLPMALLEAMSAALPAVCTAVGGIPEMIADGVTGYVVPPRDAAALAARLLDVLADPQRAREMGRAARERLETEFSLERSVQAAQRTLEETAGRATAPIGG